MNIMFITGSFWQSPIVEIDPDSEAAPFALIEAQDIETVRSISSTVGSRGTYFIKADKLDLRLPLRLDP